MQHTNLALQAQRAMLAGARRRVLCPWRVAFCAPGASPNPYAAARPPPASCHGVSTLGPSAVTAIVNSKCAASEPSWE